MFVKNKLELKNLWGRGPFRFPERRFLIFNTKILFNHTFIAHPFFYKLKLKLLNCRLYSKYLPPEYFWSKCIISKNIIPNMPTKKPAYYRGWNNNHAWNYLPESHKYTSRQESGPILSNLVCTHYLYLKTNIDYNWKIRNI